MEPHTKPVPVQPRDILVALDAGTLSNDAVLRGLELAQVFDARLGMVHAVGVSGMEWELLADPTAVSKSVDPLSKIRAAIVAQVGSLLQQHGERRERADEVVQVIAGRPASVLLERARELHTDLIVLGARRRRALLDFGSTARAVLAKASCAVWLQPCPPTPIRRILVAIDFSAESLIALATATELAHRIGARISALHVFDATQFSVDEWDGITMYVPIEEVRQAASDEFKKIVSDFNWRGVEHDAQFVGGSPSERILESGKSADLIVMGTHGRSGLAAAVLGSVAYSVLKAADRAVLVVREPKRKFKT